MRLNVDAKLPPGIDETFFELMLEDFIGCLNEALKSRKKKFSKGVILEGITRRVTIMVESEPMR